MKARRVNGQHLTFSKQQKWIGTGSAPGPLGKSESNSGVGLAVSGRPGRNQLRMKDRSQAAQYVSSTAAAIGPPRSVHVPLPTVMRTVKLGRCESCDTISVQSPAAETFAREIFRKIWMNVRNVA